ncbi:MAG: hypothetical protein WDA65_04625, partial [Christensenellales bacterium]
IEVTPAHNANLIFCISVTNFQPLLLMIHCLGRIGPSSVCMVRLINNPYYMVVLTNLYQSITI